MYNHRLNNNIMNLRFTPKYTPYNQWQGNWSPIPAYALVDAFTVWLWESQTELFKGSPKIKEGKSHLFRRKKNVKYENKKREHIGTYSINGYIIYIYIWWKFLAGNSWEVFIELAGGFSSHGADDTGADDTPQNLRLCRMAPPQLLYKLVYNPHEK